MSIRKTIGGDRLGAGKKMTVDLHGYERSTHNLSRIWRSTMAAGTLVPFLCEVTLPGDTFDIDLDVDVKTHPTVGPLFGSFKVQLDVFSIPVRLYNSWLHNNKLNIGKDMSQIKLPLVWMLVGAIDYSKPIDNQQINSSCIFHYLGIKGLGISDVTGPILRDRNFNAIPWLAYFEIYKNYYANKQEEKGAILHQDVVINEDVTEIQIHGAVLAEGTAGTPRNILTGGNMSVFITGGVTPEMIIIVSVDGEEIGLETLYRSYHYDLANGVIIMTNAMRTVSASYWRYATEEEMKQMQPRVKMFDLSEIDDMREMILAQPGNNSLDINYDLVGLPTVYKDVLTRGGTGGYWFAKQNSQEGLLLKTYQSDLFNNWMNTEWIDGEDGVNQITGIDVSEGVLYQDQLILAKKIYDMLNRIMIAGGSYNDWQETVYGEDILRNAESPMYMGGLIRELIFQEVVSNSQSTGESGQQPLGTLAGKGAMNSKQDQKGGRVQIKTREISYVMGIVSLTPRVDYSQGNKWDVDLKTMDDFHKPALDEIGFQDLITDRMAWFDTRLNADSTQTFRSAGKQPAWINYMTAVNETHGNFANEDNEMFMTLNRRYEFDYDEGVDRLQDITTYIDPVKCNYIFAQTSRDSQNFWTQIKIDLIARRKMSAKIMPNL